MAKRVWFFIGLIAIVGVTLATIFYLSTPRSQENTPIVTYAANKPPEQTFFEEVIYHGSRQRPEVALTFDADMTSGMKAKLQSGEIKSWYNSKVIDVLEKTNTPATLFLTGMWIEIYPDITKKLAKNPLFELGNHSYSHPGFTPNCYKLRPLNDSQDLTEIEKTQKILEETTGNKNQLFRFPGGCFDKNDLKVLTNLELTPIQWDVVSDDAFNQNVDQIVHRVVNHTQNGSIIVFHLHGGPNAPQTANALPIIIKDLTQKGFTFVKVSTLLTKLK